MIDIINLVTELKHISSKIKETDEELTNLISKLETIEPDLGEWWTR